MKIARLFVTFVLFFAALPAFADNIVDFYAEWRSQSVADIEAANKNFATKIEEYEKTREFAVYQVQQPAMANAILQMKDDALRGGGAKISEIMATYLAEREKIFLQSQRYIFYVVFILVLILLGILGFVFYLILFNEKKRIAREVFSELEKERSRISFELHDTAAQEIHGAILALQSGSENKKVTQLLDLSQKEIRRICAALNPPSLEISPLADLLSELCGSFKRNFGIPCEFYMAQSDLFEKRKLSDEQKVNVYRIVQESLTNVAKHSKASSAQVVFRGQEGSEKIVFFISDDGVSFDVKASEKEGHFGLKSIRQRVLFLNGKLRITSQPEIGTEIRVEF